MDDALPNVLYLGDSGSDLYNSVITDLSNSYGVDFRQQQISDIHHIKVVNCLQEQSILYVRRELNFFAKVVAKVPNGLRKTLVLENAEHLSRESQAALRRSIETNNHTTRFVMTMRDDTKVQAPILSRFVTIPVRRTTPPRKLQRSIHLEKSSPIELISRVDTLTNDCLQCNVVSSCEVELEMALSGKGCRCDYMSNLHRALLEECNLKGVRLAPLPNF